MSEFILLFICVVLWLLGGVQAIEWVELEFNKEITFGSKVNVMAAWPFVMMWCVAMAFIDWIEGKQ